MVKILFLDVDGVVNIPRGMDKGLLNNLKSIVDETGCKIVLSSDWRNAAQTRNEIRNILRSLGMDFISCTPPTRSLQNRRPEEILEWIESHDRMVEQGQGERSPSLDVGEAGRWSHCTYSPNDL
eukprot:TRINITY_DN3335_c0_g1_i3.p1 TRINITY_DN3335_c0_g1~~TRINITY_DN3335_c0_g1_i3.p1  ORF type:complete len:135 (-),score=13.10 TRINITY_DN3335_c0_g1_i3:24-395(-)